MKQAFLAAALLAGASLAAPAAHAQGVRLGIKAGANYSNLAGDLTDESRFKSKFGPHAGIMANFDLTGDGFFSIQPELLYSQKGFQYANGTFGNYKYDGRVNYNYLDLPIMLRINADGLFFEAGPQFGYLLSRKDNSKIINAQTGQVLVSNSSSSNLDNVNRTELGYAAGLGYQSDMGAMIGLRYNGGLSKYGKKDAPNNDFNNARNSAFQLYVGYLFGGK